MERQSFTRVVVALIVCFLSARAVCGAVARAFPDAEGPVLSNAEGFGAATIGGKGGKVIWVTNLNADGPGSLRAAVDTPGPRIIKFKVAGAIELGRHALWIGRPLRPIYRKLIKEGKPTDHVKNPYSFITIDGTSAPRPGITISGNLKIGPYRLKEVIVRNLRIRDNGLISRSASDCITITAGRVLVDHCSLQWARDEVLSPWGPHARDVTAQWCIIGPAWGAHAYGLINGRGSDRITVHHCLFPNNAGRNPLICGNSRKNWIGKYTNDTPVIDLRNNVAYNWFNVHSAVLTAGAHVNMVGNLYLPGRASAKNVLSICVTCRHHTNPTVAYLKGNITPNRPRDHMDEWADAGRYVKTARRYVPTFGPHEWGRKRDTPFPAPPVVTHSAAEAKALVLSQAGAWPRDPVDAGVIRTVLHNSGFMGVKNTLPSDFTNARPTAKAAAAAKAGNPLTVQFKGQGRDSDGKIVLSTWHFGDGYRALGSNVTHTYTAPGEYQATLFVVDDQGMSATASLKVAVGKGSFKAEPIAPRAPLKPAMPAALSRRTPPTVVLAPCLDNPPTEADWAAAPRLHPFIVQASWLKAPGQVDARVLHDSERLYLRVTSDGIPESSIKRMKIFEPFAALPRHGLGWCGYTKVAVFISPRHGRTPWYRFDIGINGFRKDAKGADRTWTPKPDWGVASGMVGKKWRLTLAIPFKALDATPAKGHVWGLKLMNNTGKDVIHIWPPVGPATRWRGKERHCAPHTSDPIHYARLQFP